MNWGDALDLLILVVFCVSVLTAFAKGLVGELLWLGATILGAVLAIAFYDDLTPILRPFISAQWASFVALITIFLLVVVLGSLSTMLVDRTLKLFRLKWLDRLLGIGFGLARAWLIGVVLFVGFAAFSSTQSAVWESRTAPLFLGGARTVARFLPAQLEKGFEQGYRKATLIWMEKSE